MISASEDLPVARFKASAVAQLYKNPFVIVPWYEISHIDEDRIWARVAADDVLPPSPGKMGIDLRTTYEHESRIAWLIKNPDWPPLGVQVSVTTMFQSSSLLMNDGHHRLAAGLMMGSDLLLEFTSGCRTIAEEVVAKGQGVWEIPPTKEVFGEGVFAGHGIPVHAFLKDGRVRIQDGFRGDDLAEYRSPMWRVERPYIEEDTPIFGHLDMIKSPALHRELFAEQADFHLGVGDGALRAYLNHLMSQLPGHAG